MSIPLVQEATKDAINTSIIAIKRNIERINMLLGLSNSEEIDTSEFVKKSDIVDEVTLDNMQSVTSNAVAEACTKFPDYSQYITLPSGTSSWTATEDVFVNYFVSSGNSSGYRLKINNVDVSAYDNKNSVYYEHFSGFVKKGSVLFSYLLYDSRLCKIFKLI